VQQGVRLDEREHGVEVAAHAHGAGVHELGELPRVGNGDLIRNGLQPQLQRVPRPVVDVRVSVLLALRGREDNLACQLGIVRDVIGQDAGLEFSVADSRPRRLSR
jgi:hypothetical protein